jgi:ubiquinone/menaquinone biosynthesis C-methylase UbiE
MSHWDAVAAGWAAWLEWTQRTFQPVTDWLIAAGACAPGARVLDVACGAGYPALAMAARLRPGGTVIASDLSGEMIAATAAAASAAALVNVEVRRLDAEHLDLEDASVDAVTNAYGLMFCADASRALHEAHRVLKPGGRLALVTWDDPARSSFFHVIAPAGAAHLSIAPGASGSPGPFRYSSPRELQTLLRDAGFTDVRVERVSMPMIFESADQYCQCLTDFAWKTRVAALSHVQFNALRDDVRRLVEPYVSAGRVCLNATSLCTLAKRPTS